MDFGALQCIPKNPNCQQCPLSPKCIAYNKNVVKLYPFKSKKKIKLKKDSLIFFRNNRWEIYLFREKNQKTIFGKIYTSFQ